VGLSFLFDISNHCDIYHRCIFAFHKPHEDFRTVDIGHLQFSWGVLFDLVTKLPTTLVLEIEIADSRGCFGLLMGISSITYSIIYSDSTQRRRLFLIKFFTRGLENSTTM